MWGWFHGDMAEPMASSWMRNAWCWHAKNVLAHTSTVILEKATPRIRKMNSGNSKETWHISLQAPFLPILSRLWADAQPDRQIWRIINDVIFWKKSREVQESYVSSPSEEQMNAILLAMLTWPSGCQRLQTRPGLAWRGWLLVAQLCPEDLPISHELGLSVC